MADESDYRSNRLTGSWYRLIPSRFPTVDIYRRVAPKRLWPLAAAIETITNPRVRLKNAATKGCDTKDMLPPKLQNWNHAPFSYPNAEGSHLLGEGHGVLELADTIQTALAVAIRRREAFLGATAMPPIDLEMRVLSHRVDGSFKDLTGLSQKLSVAERRAIGHRLLDQDAAGAVFKCPERPTGKMLAVFSPDVLRAAVQTQHYKFRWDGELISEIYNYRDKADGRPILADQVFSASALPLIDSET